MKVKINLGRYIQQVLYPLSLLIVEISSKLQKNRYTLLPLESLHKSSCPFLRCHVEGDARKLTVDVKGTLQLEKVPVLHDHLGLRPSHSMLNTKRVVVSMKK